MQGYIEYKRLDVCAFAQLREVVVTGEKSLHAAMRFNPGDMLIRFGAKECLAGPNRYTVQMHEEMHIMLDPEYLQYINHSCHPNVFFDFRDMTLICINPIAVGDEMTFFYPSTEWSMSHGFQCQCGSPGCLGHIHGASYLSPDVLQRYRLSEFIQQMHHKSDTYEPDVRQERMAFK